MADESYFNFKGKSISESDFKSAFALVLKQLRGSSDYRPTQAASQTGIDRSYLYRLEAGEKSPSLFTLFRIAEATDQTASQIVEFLEKALEDVSAEAP